MDERQLERLERQLWSEGPTDALLSEYQTAHRALEREVAERGADPRHHFIIFLPVADRPRHLEACLGSLLRLCRLYGYGGIRDGRFAKVTVLVADDSRAPGNRAAHRAICDRYTADGVTTHHLDQPEQLALVERLPPAERERLFGRLAPAAFCHKGSANQRNIAYLKLTELARQCDGPVLFWSIDSDQEFCVNVETPEGGRELYAVPFLHRFDRLFRETDALIATGKVVGDPPVSPAVMTSGFLDDLGAFLGQMAGIDPRAGCTFHGTAESSREEGAIYHDMADRFGFRPEREAYRYTCPLTGGHDHAACLDRFAAGLDGFFYGEHPTRKSWYRHTPLMEGVQPARTVYAGNFLFRPEGLRWFTPFAPLKLRMNGPVLGRIIQAEIGPRFVSANLPMLHRRTVEGLGRTEFRPGVDHEAEAIDLSGEFERQFYGDVMLFGMIRLTGLGYPREPLARGRIAAELAATDAELLAGYNERRRAIQEKLQRIEGLIADPIAWWGRSPEQAAAVSRLHGFAANVRRNFGDGSAAHAAINDPDHKAERHRAMVEAISRYPGDREIWQGLIG